MLKKNQELEARILDYIRFHRLIANQEKLVVAVSGGPDSVCLLYVLHHLRNELGIALHIAHLNHQLRGTESDADAAYVADLAHNLDIPITIAKEDVAGYKSRSRLSLEEAARELRYAFLARVSQSTGSAGVAVGHTTDDNIETILLHLIRGTGTRGLRGLQPRITGHFSCYQLTIIRPLLPLNRIETVNYCKEYALNPRLDTSNTSLSLLRNRIRLELLPLLRQYNPAITEALLRTSCIADKDLDFIDKEVERLQPAIIGEKDNIIVIKKKQFLNLHPALQRNFLRLAIEKLLGSLKDIETRHIEEILNALPLPAGRKICLPEGLVFSIEYDRYLLGADVSIMTPLPEIKECFTLKIPGETTIPGWTVKAYVADHQRLTAMHIHESERGQYFTACFDMDKTGEKVELRTRRPGDLFQPMGMSQFKKVGEFMLDAKIPRDWRSRIPIITSPQQILWIVGWRIDDRVKVTGDTAKILCLELERR